MPVVTCRHTAIVLFYSNDFRYDTTDTADTGNTADIANAADAVDTVDVSESIGPSKVEKECFCHDDLSEDFDPLMELVVDEGESGGCKGQQKLDAIESAVTAASRTLSSEPDLELEQSPDLKDGAKADLETLVKQCTNNPPDAIHDLEAPSDLTPESSSKKEIDFVLLHDSGDSGIGHAPPLQLLESPYVPPSSSPTLLTSTPLFRRQLGKLSPMTVTPEEEL